MNDNTTEESYTNNNSKEKQKKRGKTSHKADYYKFYLDNAQKAIDLMIE